MDRHIDLEHKVQNERLLIQAAVSLEIKLDLTDLQKNFLVTFSQKSIRVTFPVKILDFLPHEISLR